MEDRNERIRQYTLLAALLVALVILLPIRGLPGYRLADVWQWGYYGTGLSEESQRLALQAQEAQDRARQLEEQLAALQQQNGQLSERLTEAQTMAGLTALTGPGISLTVRNRADGDPDIRVQDEDLLLIINELNAAGAEAIEINGQRVVAITEIRNAGSYISINTQATSVPYVIRAIGDPGTLETAMELYGGVVDNLMDFFEVGLKQEGSITVPAYGGDLPMNYARPVEE